MSSRQISDIIIGQLNRTAKLVSQKPINDLSDPIAPSRCDSINIANTRHLTKYPIILREEEEEQKKSNMINKYLFGNNFRFQWWMGCLHIKKIIMELLKLIGFCILFANYKRLALCLFASSSFFLAQQLNSDIFFFSFSEMSRNPDLDIHYYSFMAFGTRIYRFALSLSVL